MNAWLVGLAVALAALSGFLVFELTRQPPSTAIARRAEAEPPSRTLPAAPAAPAPTVRAQIAKAVESRAESLRSEADVDRYLGDLEARARQNRRVTALEVEPGIEAIRRLEITLGPDRAQEKLVSFTGEMGKLSAEFDGRTPRRAPPTADEQ